MVHGSASWLDLNMAKTVAKVNGGYSILRSKLETDTYTLW